jgi:hypothetical protein
MLENLAALPGASLGRVITREGEAPAEPLLPARQEPRPPELGPYPSLRDWVRLMPRPNLLSLAFLCLIGANYLGTFADLDFTWQIRTGARIVDTGSLRPPDAFTYTIAGQSVPDFEWLYEVVLWAVWSVFGFGGLKLLKIYLIITPLLLVVWRLRVAHVRRHAIVLALFAAVFVLTPIWNLRPLYCTTIGLLLVSGWLHDHCTGRRPLTWWLPVVMLLWGNLHPGVITGQALLLGAIAWEWLNRWVQLNAPLDREALWRLTLVGGTGLLATLIAPNPLERLLYPLKPELAHPIMRMFAEMAPLHTFLVKKPVMIGLVYVLAALVLVSVVVRFRIYRLWEVALLAGLAGLGNLAIRSLLDWFLMMLALGLPHLVALLGQAARTDRRRNWVSALLRVDRVVRRTLNRPLLHVQPFWPAAMVALLTMVSLIPPLARRMPIQDAPGWPVGAVARIEQLGLHGRFFAFSDFGSYLTWRLGDRVKSYTDTRGFFFPPQLLEDCHFLPQLGPDWRRRLDRVLDEYGTEFFLLEVDGSRGELWRSLRPHVGEPLYQDDLAVLLTATQVRDGVRQLELTRAAALTGKTASPSVPCGQQR